MTQVSEANLDWLPLDENKVVPVAVFVMNDDWATNASSLERKRLTKNIGDEKPDLDYQLIEDTQIFGLEDDQQRNPFNVDFPLFTKSEGRLRGRKNMPVMYAVTDDKGLAYLENVEVPDDAIKVTVRLMGDDGILIAIDDELQTAMGIQLQEWSSLPEAIAELSKVASAVELSTEDNPNSEPNSDDVSDQPIDTQGETDDEVTASENVPASSAAPKADKPMEIKFGSGIPVVSVASSAASDSGVAVGNVTANEAQPVDEDDEQTPASTDLADMASDTAETEPVVDEDDQQDTVADYIEQHVPAVPEIRVPEFELSDDLTDKDKALIDAINKAQAKPMKVLQQGVEMAMAQRRNQFVTWATARFNEALAKRHDLVLSDTDVTNASGEFGQKLVDVQAQRDEAVEHVSTKVDSYREQLQVAYDRNKQQFANEAAKTAKVQYDNDHLDEFNAKVENFEQTETAKLTDKYDSLADEIKQEATAERDVMLGNVLSDVATEVFNDEFEAKVQDLNTELNELMTNFTEQVRKVNDDTLTQAIADVGMVKNGRIKLEDAAKQIAEVRTAELSNQLQKMSNHAATVESQLEALTADKDNLTAKVDILTKDKQMLTDELKEAKADNKDNMSKVFEAMQQQMMLKALNGNAETPKPDTTSTPEMQGLLAKITELQAQVSERDERDAKRKKGRTRWAIGGTVAALLAFSVGGTWYAHDMIDASKTNDKVASKTETSKTNTGRTATLKKSSSVSVSSSKASSVSAASTATSASATNTATSVSATTAQTDPVAASNSTATQDSNGRYRVNTATLAVGQVLTVVADGKTTTGSVTQVSADGTSAVVLVNGNYVTVYKG